MAIALDGNNPGGMNDGTWAKKQPGYKGANGRYAAFHTLTDGVNAMAALLRSYITRGYNTPRKIATRWAPAGDGNDSAAYATRLAKGMGFGTADKPDVDRVIPVADAGALAIVQARVENVAFPKRWNAELARVALSKAPGSNKA